MDKTSVVLEISTARDQGLRPILANMVMHGIDLVSCDLADCDFSGSDLSESDLHDADFHGSNLRRANFRMANLRNADLRGVSLTGAILDNADMRGANLGGASGLLSAVEFMSQFEKDSAGWLVYTAIGKFWRGNRSWNLYPGEFITEIANPCRTDSVGSGVRFGSLEYIRNNVVPSEIWTARINFPDGPGIVAPLRANSFGRCERLELIERIVWEGMTRGELF